MEDCRRNDTPAILLGLDVLAVSQAQPYATTGAASHRSDNPFPFLSPATPNIR
jgi:hypothetical protein